MKGRRFWMKLAGPSGDVRVYVLASMPIVDGEESQAYWDSTNNKIVVWADGSDDMVKMRLLHELLHMSFASHSGTIREKVLGCRTVEGRRRREEDICSFLDPLLYDILARNKLLKIPKPPRFPPPPKDEDDES